MTLRFRQFFGHLTRLVSPSYSCCGRCRCTWRFVREHQTDYTPTAGCFPLCEWCWQRLTPQERLPYYRQLWNSWELRGSVEDRDWNAIEQAVLVGK